MDVLGYADSPLPTPLVLRVNGVGPAGSLWRNSGSLRSLSRGKAPMGETPVLYRPPFSQHARFRGVLPGDPLARKTEGAANRPRIGARPPRAPCRSTRCRRRCFVSTPDAVGARILGVARHRGHCVPASRTGTRGAQRKKASRARDLRGLSPEATPPRERACSTQCSFYV